ncbi:MAG: altronate dehydratase family protein [Gammaproteobacteria bacterium]|nr:altronate dehydratase family protein [Gammaproteobacteria bacterium]
MSSDTSTFLQLDPADNVSVALRESDGIPAGHKKATVMIQAGKAVRKFNQIIGFASVDIAVGEHIHTHNCDFASFERDYAYGEDAVATAFVPEGERSTFMGFDRGNGKVGTRNYIGVLSTVNCSATVAKHIAAEIEKSAVLDNYPNIDGIVGLAHGMGCCMDAKDEGYANLQRVLDGYIRHPNFGAVLLIGLGCEVNQVSYLLENFGLGESRTFQTMVMQDMGGTRKTVEAGVSRIKEILPQVNAIERVPLAVSGLSVALQCGGSDGYSGITANPAMGAAVDILVRQGGTAILSETPEIYGAEHLLTRRAASREVGERLIERIQWWEDYTARNGGVMDNNPTPGNKAGGLTTILEKSLGAAAKGGTTNLNGVYKYAQQVDTRGFVFMDGPGYDPCAITGQVASGANLVCFSTGRGSAFGFKPAPSIKLATNTPMFNRLEEDMDINCGGIIDGEKSVAEVGQEIFDYLIDVASGKPSKSEMLGYGDNEFVPWQIGTVM